MTRLHLRRNRHNCLGEFWVLKWDFGCTQLFFLAASQFYDSLHTSHTHTLTHCLTQLTHSRTLQQFIFHWIQLTGLDWSEHHGQQELQPRLVLRWSAEQILGGGSGLHSIKISIAVVRTLPLALPLTNMRYITATFIVTVLASLSRSLSLSLSLYITSRWPSPDLLFDITPAYTASLSLFMCPFLTCYLEQQSWSRCRSSWKFC